MGGVVVLAWMVILLRDIRLQEQGVTEIFSHPGVAALRQGEADLQESTLLNPDTSSDVYLTELLLLSHRPRAALTTANAVVRREPANLQAWWLVEQAARTVQPRRAAQALAQVTRLDPLTVSRPLKDAHRGLPVSKLG